MKQMRFNNMKDLRKTNPVAESRVQSYSENKLTPIALSGVIAPWNQSSTCDRTSNYKLVSYSGIEYFIVANEEWRNLLSQYCWEEVKVRGLLNVAHMTLLPQKVFPKGPTGEDVIDVALWSKMDFVKKVAKNINDFVVIPAAVFAIMAA